MVPRELGLAMAMNISRRKLLLADGEPTSALDVTTTGTDCPPDDGNLEMTLEQESLL